MVRSDVPIYYSTDDLFGDSGCDTRGMARAHDGLMMQLMVGRNHALRLIVFYDGWLSLMIIVILSMMDVISFMMMDVSCI